MKMEYDDGLTIHDYIFLIAPFLLVIISILFVLLDNDPSHFDPTLPY